ncbi:sugar ABC transporter permease [Gracilibacillus kekensis]|uniref:Xylose transport system permease protein XylH n=1 Tax=Gracilibacillus kekensis TaxID=1027249 RepID=A0A1M7IQW5_9BACI|nr:sugar ABC transporter permease [Gracilibacillus kekensis]SHM43023.1 xylose ABC transporter membrane protein [Gracilibacillus kekensis]
MSAVEEVQEHVEEKQIKKKIFKLDVRAYTMIVALVAIWLLFSMLNDAFLTPRNLSNLFLQMSVTAILAIGMVMIIVAGQIDLSVGSLVGLTGGVAAILNVWLGMHPILVILLTVLLGALIGLFQGWWVAYRAVPAFIVTLGGMLIFRGILQGITGSQTVAPLTPGLKILGQGYIPSPVGLGIGIVAIIITTYMIITKRNARIKYGFDVFSKKLTVSQIAIFCLIIISYVMLMNAYQGIPVPILLVIFLAIIFTIIAKNTVFGRQVYAIGGNPEAASLSGINIKRRILTVFVLGNTLAAIAGLILTARVNAATTSAGTMYELDAIAACVIGGTSLMGGVGTIAGAVIGALVMASLDNGMSIMNIDVFWQSIVKGSILILAVWVDIYSRKRKPKK